MSAARVNSQSGMSNMSVRHEFLLVTGQSGMNFFQVNKQKFHLVKTTTTTLPPSPPLTKLPPPPAIPPMTITPPPATLPVKTPPHIATPPMKVPPPPSTPPPITMPPLPATPPMKRRLRQSRRRWQPRRNSSSSIQRQPRKICRRKTEKVEKRKID